MNILILGATGFLGSWVTTRLLKQGHDVLCAVRDTEDAQQKFPKAAFCYVDFLKSSSVDEWIE